MSPVTPEIERLRALRSIKSNLLRLKWLAAATRFEIAFTRHDRALKAGFNPDQPRVPAGNREGGRWTSEDGRGVLPPVGADRVGASEGRYPAQFNPDERSLSSEQLIKAGGEDLGSFGNGVSVVKGPGISYEERFDPQTGVTTLLFTGNGSVVVDQKVGNEVTGSAYDVGTRARPDQGLNITIDPNGKVRAYPTVRS